LSALLFNLGIYSGIERFDDAKLARPLALPLACPVKVCVNSQRMSVLTHYFVDLAFARCVENLA
jgi:hypothetical protein